MFYKLSHAHRKSVKMRCISILHSQDFPNKFSTVKIWSIADFVYKSCLVFTDYMIGIILKLLLIIVVSILYPVHNNGITQYL
jgi:hypothetical protein